MPKDQETATRLRLPPRLHAPLFWGLLGAVTVVALVQRWPGLNPSSLYLDDVWAAFLVKAAGAGEILEVRPPAPLGFLAVLKTLRAALGDGAWVLQMLPLAAGLALVPLMGYAAHRVTGSRAMGLVAAMLVAANDTLAVYSLRVKPFTLDGLLTLALVTLAVAWWRRPRRTVLLSFAAVAVAGPWLSLTAILPAAILVSLIALDVLRIPGRPDARSVLVVVAVVTLLLLIEYLLLLKGASRPALVSYWEDHYLPLGAGLPAFAAGPGLRLFTGAFARLPWLAVAVVAGLWWLLREPQTRPLGVCVLVFYAAVLSLSALRVYPVGGGRTDVFSYPVAILVATAGTWSVARLGRLVPVAVVGAAGILFVAQAALVRYTYPVSGDRQAVELAAAAARDGDALVVYPWANWAAGYYGPWPGRIVGVDDSTNGFYVHLERPDTLVLHETRQGTEFRDHPQVVVEQLRPFLEGGYGRIVYLSTNADPQVQGWIVYFLQTQGYVPVRSANHGSAWLVVFEKKDGYE